MPPPPHELQHALSELERFLHSGAQLPLLIKIGLVHAQFETIHPFLDGNGRVGRLLIVFLLCECRVLTKPVLYLSHYLKKLRQEYYDRLQAVRDAGQWEEWLKFFLQGVAEVSKQATETVRRILGLREEGREIITKEFGRAVAGGLRTLEYLYEHPIVSVRDVQEFTGISYPAANQLVAKLVRLEILQEFTGHVRNRRFIYRRFINLFVEV